MILRALCDFCRGTYKLLKGCSFFLKVSVVKEILVLLSPYPETYSSEWTVKRFCIHPWKLLQKGWFQTSSFWSFLNFTLILRVFPVSRLHNKRSPGTSFSLFPLRSLIVTILDRYVLCVHILTSASPEALWPEPDISSHILKLSIVFRLWKCRKVYRQDQKAI